MKQQFTAASRNARPILRVLRTVLPPNASVLELASGTGQHAAFFVPQLDLASWQPSEMDGEKMASISAWRESLTDTEAADRFLPPIRLDVRAGDWPPGPFDAIFACNLLHVSPSDLTGHLFAACAQRLTPAGQLLVYGPYRIDGQHNSPGNAEFDQTLRRQNPSWGIRDTGDLAAEARSFGLNLCRRVRMPANNFILIFARR